jgi:FkbM family methyltransferase
MEFSTRAGLRGFLLAWLPPIVVDGIRRLRRPAIDRRAGAGVPNVATSETGPPSARQPIRRFWGLHQLDRQIEKYLDFDNGYYVELGANDGKLSSNTFYYEQCRGWRGVLIEPAPNLFLQCRANRSPDNYVICGACVSFDYRDEFVKIVYSDSMSVSLNIESDIGDPMAHAELGRQFLKPGETVFTFGALARTLNSILLEANAPRRVDFLSLDVEGSELDVLKGVDHDTFRFRYMLIECRNLARLQDYLGPLRYQLLEKFNEHDYLFGDSSATP